MPHDDDTPTLGAESNSHSDDKSTIGSAPRAWPADPGEAFEKPGDVIGPYRLIKRLGEGGFGAVYLAEQSEPVKREVALKIIKVGMDTREVIARFEAERQALALMDHPNVARIIGAGATDRGRPYFVMDLVRGEPITTYCDRKRLPTRQRLALFQQVCDAVQHAHLKGIIHRDIKPSNVLVAEIDGVPIPKVIDFGIAKATDATDSERTMFTQSGQVIGTPEYMSPEQASGRILDIDTRSDVYALGVLLYELLAGAPPFDSRRLRAAGYAEILRIIREEDPPRLSTRLSSLGAGATEVAARRDTDPAHLRSSFRGDLDWVVMRALEKDRERRYSTASGLASDISRFLRNEPIEARPPSRAYKLRKFVRRNTAGVAAALLVVLAILVGSGLAVAGFVQASRQRDIAVAAESRAVAEAQRATTAESKAVAEARTATQISDFLTDMLKGVGPNVAIGRDTTLLREILDKTVERVDKDLADQPLVASRVLRVISMVFNKLADYEKAEATARRAVELAKAAPGANAIEVAASVHDVALILESRGRYDQAVELFQESFDGYKAAGAEDNLNAVSALSGIAGIYWRTNRYDEALPMLRDIVERCRRITNGADAENLANAMDRLSLTLSSLHQDDEAESVARETLEMRHRLFGEVHPDIAVSLSNLAVIVSLQDRYDEAIALSKQAVEQHRLIYGERHPYTASALGAYASILEASGKKDQAIPIRRSTLEIFQEVHGPMHRDTLNAVYALGKTLDETGDFPGAEVQYRTLLDAARTMYKPPHGGICGVLMVLAPVIEKQGRLAEAEALYREAYEGFLTLRPPGHRQRVQARDALVANLAAQKNFADAEAILLAAEEVTRAQDIPAPVRAEVIRSLADFYTNWNSAEPNAGHDTQSETWRSQIPGTPPSEPLPRP